VREFHIGLTTGLAFHAKWVAETGACFAFVGHADVAFDAGGGRVGIAGFAEVVFTAFGLLVALLVGLAVSGLFAALVGDQSAHVLVVAGSLLSGGQAATVALLASLGALASRAPAKVSVGAVVVGRVALLGQGDAHVIRIALARLTVHGDTGQVGLASLGALE
jgi:hypothetical protein